MLRRIGTTLAVFHSADSDVQSHVAPLRRLPAYSVICRVQSRAFDDEFGSTLPGCVLWELAPGRRPNWRRLHAVAQGARVVSYSADTTAMVMERSRRFGFSSHLTAPLRPIEVAHQVAIGAPGDLAIRWRTARSALIRFLGRLDTVNQLVRDAAERFDPVEVAEALVHRAAAWLPGTRWAMVALDDAAAARVLAGWRLAAPLHPVACALGLQAMKSQAPHGVADLSDDRRHVAGPAAAALAIPLRCRGSVVGALVGLDEAPSARRPEVSRRLTEVLAKVLEPGALALDNAIRLSRMQELTVTDDLTQLFNARYLNEVIRREGKRAARSALPLSVLFLDLDGFKDVNDSYGHLNGSRALAEVGKLLGDCARESDTVARYGGDEFVVVLPETDSHGALVVAERIRRCINGYVFLIDQGCHVRLTVSTGIATFPDSVRLVDRLLATADEAMYWIKNNGKNGVRLAAAAVGSVIKEDSSR